MDVAQYVRRIHTRLSGSRRTPTTVGGVMRRVVALFGATLVVITGCSPGSDAAGIENVSESSSSTTSAPTTVVTTVASTTTEVVDDGRDASCVVAVVAGDSLGQIAARTGDVGLTQLQEENRLDLDTVIHPGDELDICIGNDVDDVLGVSRLAPAPVAVRRQQEKLNELFASYRLIPLGVDGASGPLTRQMLCAARLGLGLPVSGAHLAEDSPEAERLLAADSLSVPAGAATWSTKWILIDKTCQVMFTGEGDELLNVYPTSTGEAGYETRVGQAFDAFRYDPALDTDGWHDSTNFPVDVDNPLNGNMYKPLYFNSGQAIHGANYVPPEPRSKGCARTFPLHQDEIVSWIGLEERTSPTWRAADIGVTVTVQGDFRALD